MRLHDSSVILIHSQQSWIRIGKKFVCMLCVSSDISNSLMSQTEACYTVNDRSHSQSGECVRSVIKLNSQTVQHYTTLQKMAPYKEKISFIKSDLFISYDKISEPNICSLNLFLDIFYLFHTLYVFFFFCYWHNIVFFLNFHFLKEAITCQWIKKI